MIITTWFERGSSRPLRARIRSTTNVSNGFERDETTADSDTASEVVKTWLEAAEASGGSIDDEAGRVDSAPDS